MQMDRFNTKMDEFWKFSMWQLTWEHLWSTSTLPSVKLWIIGKISYLKGNGQSSVKMFLLSLLTMVVEEQILSSKIRSLFRRAKANRVTKVVSCDTWQILCHFVQKRDIRCGFLFAFLYIVPTHKGKNLLLG